MSKDRHNATTIWISRLKEGDRKAVGPIWDRYFRRLVWLARLRLEGLPRRPGEPDEEDIALSVFNSLWRGIERGRFPRLNDRTDLWRLLVFITAQKVYDWRRRKPGPSIANGVVELDDVIGVDPTPEFAAMVAEQYRNMLGLLDDDSLRRIAVWRLEGYSNLEIKDLEGCALKTVSNRLKEIRMIWVRAGLMDGDDHEYDTRDDAETRVESGVQANASSTFES